MKSNNEEKPCTLVILSQNYRLIKSQSYGRVRKAIDVCLNKRKIKFFVDLTLVFIKIQVENNWMLAVVIKPNLVLDGIIGLSG